MRRTTKRIYDIASNAWFMFVAGATSILAFIGWLYEKAGFELTKAKNLRQAYENAGEFISDPATIGFAVSGFLFFVGIVYSIRVRWENMALRQMSTIFYQINNIYKDELQKDFHKKSPITDPRSLMLAEGRVLQAVSQQIAKIFTLAVGRPCLVTVKLVTKNEAGAYASTHVRSEEMCHRDRNGIKPFAIGTGENTGMDQTLSVSADGKPPHFFSPDLLKEAGYCNQRQHFEHYYRSILVVPIRGDTPNGDTSKTDADLIGFLSVDTMSTNRLNDRYHLYMIAALAHQMYNFMSLMRGRFSVSIGV
jgi:hypothetical protein